VAILTCERSRAGMFSYAPGVRGGDMRRGDDNSRGKMQNVRGDSSDVRIEVYSVAVAMLRYFSESHERPNSTGMTPVPNQLWRIAHA
jgi:hypothetical protein